MAHGPLLIVLETQADTAIPMATAFTKAGFLFRLVTEPKAVLQVASTPPVAIVVSAEPQDPAVRQLIELADGSPRLARVPVVLLCQDTSERPRLARLRSGVVELLQKPFNASAHPERIRQLLKELPERPGTARGSSVRELVGHVRRFFRSGALELSTASGGRSRAVFARGVLQSAEHEGSRGEAALVAMLPIRAPCVFAELGAGILVTAGADDEEILEGEIVQELEPSARAVSLLFVDDDPDLCRMFRTFFQRNGFDVSVAADGLEGLDAALARPFDLIVADLAMPRLDGWGMLRRLREDYRTRETPIALLSNHDDYRDALKAQNAGAQAYFSKTTRLEALTQKVKALLQPRERFGQQLRSGALSKMPLSELGPQWVLRGLGSAGARGRLVARDSWAEYVVFLDGGRLLDAAARSGNQQVEGERALVALLASRAAEATWQAAGDGPKPTLGGPVGDYLDRAVAALNTHAERARDALLVDPGAVEVNVELYRVYQQNGPEQWLSTAKLLCEEKMSPKEILATLDQSPLELEEALKDLLRRGVVSLEGPKGARPA